MDSSESSSDPWSSSTESNDEPHRAGGINDLDSRNAEEVSLAAIAGVVANLNEKIWLLRREILELRNCVTLSVVRNSAEIERGNPSGSAPEDQRTARNLGISFVRKIMPLAFFERTIFRRNNQSIDESTSGSKLSISSNGIQRLPFKSKTQSERRSRLVYVVGAQAESSSAGPFKPEKDSRIRKKQLPGRGSTEAVSENDEIADREEEKKPDVPTKINEGRKKDAASKNVGDDDGGGMINASESCLTNERACVKRKREGKRMGKWKNSESEGPIELNKCLNAKCHGKRVRKRISRGVQTVPKKRYGFVNLLRKFRWRSRKKRRKEKVPIAAGETPSKKGSADMIFETSGASARSQEDDTGQNIESYGATSETNDERKGERKRRSDDLQARNHNRDEKKVGKIRKGKINDRVTKGENRKLPGNTTETGERSDLRDEKKNAGRRSAGKSKGKEGNSPSSDVVTSDRTCEPRTDESKPRESVIQKTDPIDKTEIIREGKKLKKMNNGDEGAQFERRKIDKHDADAAEKPAAKRRTKRSRNRKNPSTFEPFTDSVRNSPAQQRPSLDDKKQEIGNKLVAERLDARKNDIADVKRRLDACIDDLNDIIFTLSDLFREDSTSETSGRRRRPITG